MLRHGRTGAEIRSGALVLLAALFLVLLSADTSAAQSITFTSATATWSNAQDNVPGSQPGDPVISNGAPTSSISWGTSSGPQSGYDVSITIPDPTMFPVASFSHRNFPVSDPSLTSVELDIVLDFQVDGVQTGPLTFNFTFTHEETPNNLNPCPYPTPPGEGCTDRVTFLDAPVPTTFTVGGKTYTLGMTFLDSSGNPVDEFITSEGGVVNTADLDVQFALVPPVLEVAKTGPAMLALGAPGDFSIDVRNSGPNVAWNATLRDVLPDGATAGMCDATPQVLSAQVFAADGVTPVAGKGPLSQGSDFALSYLAAPSCELALTMLTAASAIGPDERLILTYRTRLDGGSQGGLALTNVAGATEWFDDDPSNPGRSAIARALSDGTVGTTDHEDAHTLTTELPDFLYEKTVVDPASGTPLTTALPGDTLRYRLRLENRTGGALVGLGFRDEIDRLNASPLFVPGSLALVSVPAGADTTNTDPNGGAAGTGLVDVRNVSVAAGGSALLEFDVNLVAAIPDGTLATDQAELLIANVAYGLSDDPGVNGAADPFLAGDEDPTIVTIASVPDLVVEKVSAYIDGDPNVLLAGERLRYTIRIANVGTEDALDVSVRDAVPANTSYVPGSTRLNGVAVADAAGGFSPLASGMLVSAPSAAGTPGLVPADRASADPANVATLVFDVVVDANAIDGTVLSNQAFATTVPGGIVDEPSDDPRTPTADDPTRDVVGNAPLLFASKDVVLLADGGTPNIVDPGDTLRYTITIVNSAATPVTGAMLRDAVPANTTYEPGTTTLNGLAVPDSGGFPLAGGLPVSSTDLTPPLPGPGAGVINGGQSAQVVFVLRVVNPTPAGTILSNQATVTTVELPNLLTDGDGNPATGPEPTVVVVGGGQQLQITKLVNVVGGGPALAGGQLEYTVLVRNIASVDALDVVITDDLDVPVAGQLIYVAGSATLNGLAAGTSFAGSTLTADVGATYGALARGATAVLRFRADIAGSLAMGTRITNTAVVTWNAASQSANASVSIDVGGSPGAGLVSGRVWHDEDFDNVLGASELELAGWTVDLLRNGVSVQTVTTDAAGAWRMSGLAPNDLNGDLYALRFSGPGAGAASASLGLTDSVFTDGQQEITDVIVPSGANLVDLDLPIDPNGVVYDSLGRSPVAGAVLTLIHATSGSPVVATCFEDSAQQGQVTRTDGYYKFELNFSDASCPAGEGYVIDVAAPIGSGFAAGLSQIIPPLTAPTDPPFDVPSCPGGANDAVPATGAHCEMQASSLLPPPSVPARSAGTDYRAHLTLDATALPGSAALFNNHIPVDPLILGNVTVTKTTPNREVVRGDLVPYEIVVANRLASPLSDLTLVDRFPTGFKYVEGSARVDGAPLEPTHDAAARTLTWADVGVDGAATRTVAMLLAVGGGVGEGRFTNRVQALSSITGAAYSGEATASVRIVADPDFACTDVIGKVFDDRDRDGRQGEGERGIAGAQVVTPRGLTATTDEHGRFHITCAVVPREDRGSNFVLKLDERSLPSGYRMSTRPVQVRRATQGKALRFLFGASAHRIVGLDLADAVFEEGSTELRPEWLPQLERLLDELAQSESTLRLAYLGDTEGGALVERRLGKIKQEIAKRWEEVHPEGRRTLDIETQVHWRRGAPAQGSRIAQWGAALVEDIADSLRSDALDDVDGTPTSETPLPVAGLPKWGIDSHEAPRSDRLEEREARVEQVEVVKLRDVVAPVRFASGRADIPAATVEELRQVLARMRDLDNVRLHLVGHADDQPLSPSLAATYGDNEGLSRARAGEVAAHLREELGLAPESVSISFAGAEQPIASNAGEAGRARNRRVEVEVWYDEVREGSELREVVVADVTRQTQVCRTQTLCRLRYRPGYERRTRLQNLVAPMRVPQGRIVVADAFVDEVRRAFENLRGESNVSVRVLGYTDASALDELDQRVYGTHLALSKANAHRVARVLQERLKLPSSAIASDGHGERFAVASNATAHGRELNRRVEIEFWYDDPLHELPEELQPCPAPDDAELVTRVYDPSGGAFESIAFEQGEPRVPAGLASRLEQTLAEARRDHPEAIGLRLRFRGYTRNERLDRRTAAVYGDDVGLSAARARRAMERMLEDAGLAGADAEHEGRGFVHAADVVNGGFVQGDTDHVRAEVVYDERSLIDDRTGVDVEPVTRAFALQEPLALNPMRITIDGEPLDDPGRSSADVQRCTDAALDAEDLRFEFDAIESQPRLSVTAERGTVEVAQGGSSVGEPQSASAANADATPGSAGAALAFRMYTNYPHFIRRSEVRIFELGASLQSGPLAVVPVDAYGRASWTPDASLVATPVRELMYVLRAYDAQERFDETAPQRLWLVPASSGSTVVRADGGAETAESVRVPNPPDAMLDGYGESGALRRRIALDGLGTVRVSGRDVPDSRRVFVGGSEVPVDENGAFVAELLLPVGAHAVEVALIDSAGNADMFVRDLEIGSDDWFYVGVADVTLSHHESSGAWEQLEGEGSSFKRDSKADGRFAFFVDGRFEALGEDFGLVAHADTDEGPLADLFDDFVDKQPDALFRRIDSEDHYPTFGDEGTVEEEAPTSGKFYAKLSRGDDHAMWGNFKVAYLENEIAQVDRGLYGANARYLSEDATSFGDSRLAIDGFAATPGTLASRDEFRATGGSLYYLRIQDFLEGSERVRIEIRDDDSGLVTGVAHLRPNVDYDVDYLQGRILLSEPLSSTAADNSLVRNQGLDGDEVWLVVQYEYTPGVGDFDALSTGGQAHYWLADSVRMGATASHNDDAAGEADLYATDLTLRRSSASWAKFQYGRSEGLVSSPLQSRDGGFSFLGAPAVAPTLAEANAYRVDTALGFAEWLPEGLGRGDVSAYAQLMDAGYSAPGQLAPTRTHAYGGLLRLPVTDQLEVRAKADHRDADAALTTTSAEIDAAYAIDRNWSLRAGGRHEQRDDDSPVVAVSQEEGQRTDAVVQVDYDSRNRWSTYAFGQGTVHKTGNRDRNDRYGVGGKWRANSRWVLDGEVSHGESGPGVKIGSNLQETADTRRYTSYAYENERGFDGRHERRGNLVSGVRTRFSDSGSVFVEDRFQHGETSNGLARAMGMELALSERWTLGASWEVGTLRDAQTYAETERNAGGAVLAYRFDALQFTTAVEYRDDDAEQTDGSRTQRELWLFKNDLKFQVLPDWQIIAKGNHSMSESSLGEAFDGGYTEAVIGYAYRPVDHDRLDVLTKYTWFANLPTAGQVGSSGAGSSFAQRSHVASLDVSYDLTERLAVGGKYAFRRGEVSVDRIDPTYFSNDAHLGILRSELRVRDHWEVMGEGRWLELPDMDERRIGGLFALYRYFGEHLKAGVGYNFTDFSEDLTDLDYNHHGLFLNVVGSF